MSPLTLRLLLAAFCTAAFRIVWNNNNIRLELLTISEPKPSLSIAIGRTLVEYKNDRKALYHERNEIMIKDTWYNRGYGYAYEKHNLLLGARLLEEEDVVTGEMYLRVRIDNYFSAGQNETRDVDGSSCSLWTIWTRVEGPEIFAGSAKPHSTTGSTEDGGVDCYWEFITPPLQRQGTYRVHVKLLVYNGRAPIDPVQCVGTKEIRQNFTLTMNATLAKVDSVEHFRGLRSNSPWEACCEICARTENCTYWVSPKGGRLPEDVPFGCDLHFGEIEETTPLSPFSTNSVATKQWKGALGVWPQRDVQPQELVFHGRPHKTTTSYFVGCGWSFWLSRDYPCLDPALDDSVPVFPNHRFDFHPAALSTNNSANEVHDAAETELPLCRNDLHEEFQDKVANGRWVRQPWPTDEECPVPMLVDSNASDMFEIMLHDSERPHCWHRDNLTVIGQKCTDLCQEETVRSWQSPIKNESRWFGTWQHCNCVYREFTDRQLTQCMQTRKVHELSYPGASLAWFLRNYFEQRLRNVDLYAQKEQDDKTTLVIDTFGNPHRLWHQGRKEWKKFADDLPMVPDNEISFFISGYYYSSEREPHLQVARAQEFNELLMEKVQSKGYHFINAFDMSAAFPYDTAAQMDGVHLIGPNAKMIVTKVFHYLCSDVV